MAFSPKPTEVDAGLADSDVLYSGRRLSDEDGHVPPEIDQSNSVENTGISAKQGNDSGDAPQAASRDMGEKDSSLPTSNAEASAKQNAGGDAEQAANGENSNKEEFVFVDLGDGLSPTGETTPQAGSDEQDRRAWAKKWNPFSSSGSAKSGGGAKEESRASSFKRTLSSKISIFSSKSKKDEEKKEKKPLLPEVGAHVRVHSLVSASRYNDSHGIIQEMVGDGETARLVVRLDGHERKQISVKHANVDVLKLPDKKVNATADNGGASMLKIAASSIIKPRGGGSTNYYEELGVSPTATQKEIKDAYYSMAKHWHPDKNKHDPQAEVKFKKISEAYQVLSDPEKRRIYDENGVEGLEEFNIEHFKAFASTLFGGDEFHDIFGDVCELPVFKDMVQMIVDTQGGKTEPDHAQRAEKLKEYMAEEEAYIKRIAERLSRRLVARANGEVSPEAFKTSSREWASSLCQAPGGMDLVEMTGNAWRRKARKLIGGFGGMFQEVKDFKNRVAEGSSLLYGAIKCSSMAGSLSKAAKDKEKDAPAKIAGDTAQQQEEEEQQQQQEQQQQEQEEE
eukprot:CAMPEP_0181319174 /NCGR_PEP_ID=MMETSP1101-20121128/17424_1 /TAXON_ID=46948 /ORGANISM="Rhodomonas abbreviata, Strain Caron Lab Isolate" /LENGTH=564 /DNA_ID=CAMNT_0023426743 /DNA_START=33 /DNA_END=1725 /DNA_ORIENTATION=+